MRLDIASRRNQAREGWFGWRLTWQRHTIALSGVLLFESWKLLGFDKVFCNLILQCISTTSFFLLINGSAYGSFKAERGIRQGDPLSPYLFIIYTEVLSRLLVAKEREGNIHGIRTAPNAPPISHLFFVDVLICYCRATKKELQEIKVVLHNFCTCSGLGINEAKSGIFWSKNMTWKI